MYLVGNKADLTDERTISIEDANAMAEKLHAYYFETSAKTGQNINELFEDIAYQIEKTEHHEPVQAQPILQENPRKRMRFFNFFNKTEIYVFFFPLKIHIINKN